MQADRYLNPFTDFGFKRLFGEEPQRELLLNFLNELLHEKEKVKLKALLISKMSN